MLPLRGELDQIPVACTCSAANTSDITSPAKQRIVQIVLPVNTSIEVVSLNLFEMVDCM